MGLSQTYPPPVIPPLRNWKSVNGSAGALGTGNAPKGAVWYVDSSNPNALDSGGNPLSPGPRNQGTDPKTPFATLAFAIGGTVTSARTPSGVRSNNGDVVIVAAGHVEALTAALTMALAGVTVIFEGNGFGDCAQIQLGATAAQFLITGAGNHFVRPMFVTTIDAVVAGIQVQAADTVFEDAEYYDTAAKASLIQVLTTAAANRLRIKGYRYYASTTGTQKTEGIRIVGGTGLHLEDINIRGDFSTAAFNNITTAFTDAFLKNVILENINATPHATLAVLTTSTGTGLQILIVYPSGTPITASNILSFDIASSKVVPGAAASALT